MGIEFKIIQELNATTGMIVKDVTIMGSSVFGVRVGDIELMSV